MARGLCGLADGRCVSFQSEPAQPVMNGLDCLGGGARPIGVLDTKEIGAVMVTGEQAVEQGRACPANMQKPGRRGGKTGDDVHGLLRPRC